MKHDLQSMRVAVLGQLVLGKRGGCRDAVVALRANEHLNHDGLADDVARALFDELPSLFAEALLLHMARHRRSARRRGLRVADTAAQFGDGGRLSRFAVEAVVRPGGVDGVGDVDGRCSGGRLRRCGPRGHARRGSAHARTWQTEKVERARGEQHLGVARQPAQPSRHAPNRLVQVAEGEQVAVEQQQQPAGLERLCQCDIERLVVREFIGKAVQAFGELLWRAARIEDRHAFGRGPCHQGSQQGLGRAGRVGAETGDDHQAAAQSQATGE